MPLGVGWLAAVLLFFRYQGMNLKSLDCGGQYSNSCTHILPDKLDNMISLVVFITLFILSVVAYGWLRMNQSNIS
jgi:hypothetical protein